MSMPNTHQQSLADVGSEIIPLMLERALVSVYNRFAQLINDLERNGIIFPNVTVNTKFLNCLQSEWLNYVTQVRLAKRLTEDYYDDLLNYLQQFKKLVIASRAKKVEKSHDPLALVNDAGNIQRTLRTTSLGTVANVECYNCSEKGHYACNCPKPRVRDSKYFMEQMFLVKQDEARVILTDEQNDFLFADASRMKEIKELSANIYLMARIQPANFDSDEASSYDSVFLSETQTILKRRMSENEDKYHDTVIDLEARAKKNEDVVLKMGNSLQGMFMFGPKPMSFYDSKVKHGLGYTNFYTLKKAISHNLKLYDASCLDDSNIQMNVRDTEDILDDATKSQIKMKKKSQDPIAIEKKMFGQLITKS
ncbi:integrase, catalytic region, zinc finger, CCHC-type containing protein [Tanacetum coccineum]